jgi:hypothetical protein
LGERACNHCPHGFARQTVAPVFAGDNVADLVALPHPRLADHLAFKHDGKIIRLCGIACFDRARHELESLRRRGMRQGRPIEHRLGIAEDCVQRVGVVQGHATKQKPFGSDNRIGRVHMTAPLTYDGDMGGMRCRMR